jgi:hypothetical protein
MLFAPLEAVSAVHAGVTPVLRRGTGGAALCSRGGRDSPSATAPSPLADPSLDGEQAALVEGGEAMVSSDEAL